MGKCATRELGFDSRRGRRFSPHHNVLPYSYCQWVLFPWIREAVLQEVNRKGFKSNHRHIIYTVRLHSVVLLWRQKVCRLLFIPDTLLRLLYGLCTQHQATQQNLPYCCHIQGNIFGIVRKIARNDCYLRHVCPSVRMEQLGSHWTDFHVIWYFSVFSKVCR